MKKVSCKILFLFFFLLLLSILVPQNVSLEIIPKNQTSNNRSPNLSEFYASEKTNSFITSWDRTYGGAEDDCAYSLVRDFDGGYVLAGYTCSFGSDNCDALLVKTDIFGSMQWNKTYGGSGHDEAHSLIRTLDGGFVIAGTTDSFGFGGFDAWLIRIDSSGNMLWNKTYGGTGNDEAWSVIATADGGLATAGWTTSFGMSSGDFWLIKTDASGNLEWSKTYGGIFFDAASSLQQTLDEGFVLAGYTYSFGSGGSDFWLIKTDCQGNVQWNKTYGGSNEDYSFSVVQTFDGGYAIAGSTSSSGAGLYDFWLIKTDYLGQPIWNKTYGGLGYDEAWSIIQISSTSLVLVGWTESFGSGNSDCWLIITDAYGNIQSNKTWGGTNYDYAYSAVLTLDGVYVLTGQTASFGNGGYDFLLIKIRENEEISGGSFGGSMRLLK